MERIKKEFNEWMLNNGVDLIYVVDMIRLWAKIFPEDADLLMLEVNLNDVFCL